MKDIVEVSNISPVEFMRRKRQAANIANLKQLGGRSRFNVIEIKGGELEKERIEERNEMAQVRKDKRDRFINRSFQTIYKEDMKFITKMADFRTSRNTYNRETEKNMKVISKLNLTMSNESLKAGGWVPPPMISPRTEEDNDSLIDFPQINCNRSFYLEKNTKNILDNMNFTMGSDTSVQIFPPSIMKTDQI